MKVRVLAFGRLRELLGGSHHALDLPAGATTTDVWHACVARCGALTELAESTRIAHNGRLVGGSEALVEDDEVALLPPVGGG